MKVDRNQPSFPVAEQVNDQGPGYGIPLRLEIAARILAGYAGNPDGSIDNVIHPHRALSIADALIEEHNRTCQERK